jgi:hypothetical protein
LLRGGSVPVSVQPQSFFSFCHRRVGRKLATAAKQHGEIPYHFRCVVVNETTVISHVHEAEPSLAPGFPAGSTV